MSDVDRVELPHLMSRSIHSYPRPAVPLTTFPTARERCGGEITVILLLTRDHTWHKPRKPNQLRSGEDSGMSSIDG